MGFLGCLGGPGEAVTAHARGVPSMVVTGTGCLRPPRQARAAPSTVPSSRSRNPASAPSRKTAGRNASAGKATAAAGPARKAAATPARAAAAGTAATQRAIQKAQAARDARAGAPAAKKPVQAGARRQPETPLPAGRLAKPGLERNMALRPRYDAPDYAGSHKLGGMAAIVTGGDSGIGRSVAVLFAREGADVAIVYLDEHEDAEDTRRAVEAEGRRCILIPGDVRKPAFCKRAVEKTVKAFGRLDVLVNNGAFQQPNQGLDSIEDAIFEDHFRTNVFGPFYLTKAALPHLKPGASVIFTSSVNSKHPMPSLLAYSATKGALSNLVLSLSQLLAEKGIRVNGVLPGPIWTPFIPSGMSEDSVKSFGSQVPFGRPGQPAELASAYVMLASQESSYTSGALVTVAGAMPVL